jgi:hypothetical protein
MKMAAVLAVLLLPAVAVAQTAPSTQAGAGGSAARRGGRGRAPVVPTLGLEHGIAEMDAGDFVLKLVKDSGTVAGLEPRGVKSIGETPFDFTPSDQLTARAGNRFHQLGDITLRVKVGDGAWTDFDSSADRKPVGAVAEGMAPPAGFTILAAADMGPTLGADCPLTVYRYWQLDPAQHLTMHFNVWNKTKEPVTIGGVGFPMIFNNMIQDFTANRARTLPQANETCSFFDPSIALDAGYLQVTRLSGAGPALVVVPETGTHTPFEAYRPLRDASPSSQTFEGAYEWTVHSQGYAEKEWKGVNEWNPSTEQTLQPGERASYGLTFLLSDSIRDIEKTLAADDRPVAVGIPGYIVPMDVDAKLFLTPGKRTVAKIESDPKGALEVAADQTDHGPSIVGYLIHGKVWGRSRLVITYSDGTVQSVAYDVIKPAAEAVADLGNFLFTKQWFVDPSDPFHRSPSVMTYDRSKNQIVTQDTRVWISGLEDEGGSGSWVAAAMKEFGQPKKEEVDKLSEFVDKVLWGGIQYSDGPRKYGVRKSLFYYDPQDLPDFKYAPGNWTSWTSWSKRASEDTGRAYNYPHVVAAYWAMYRIARNYPGMVTAHPAEWYLDQAFNTVKFLTGGFAQNGRGRGVGYLNTGLMEGDVFVMLLKDLKREGRTEDAVYLEAAMKKRADRWNAEAYPFGSEMAWDSTGQEEVYAWTTYFGYHDKAEVALNSVLGCMPTIPNWGYNGNARRYWDFIYGAAPGQGIERQIHHYGSGINAIPVLAEYRQHPDDLYLLRVGYAGSMAALSNIDQEGFASAAFHSAPTKMRWDAYSGDYGPNFFGHAVTDGTYVVDDPVYGWQAFGGNVSQAQGKVVVEPKDSFRKRVYIAPLGLYLTLDVGTFRSVTVDMKTPRVVVTLDPATAFTPNALLRIEQYDPFHHISWSFDVTGNYAKQRNGYVIPLDKDVTMVEIANERQ